MKPFGQNLRDLSCYHECNEGLFLSEFLKLLPVCNKKGAVHLCNHGGGSPVVQQKTDLTEEDMLILTQDYHCIRLILQGVLQYSHRAFLDNVQLISFLALPDDNITLFLYHPNHEDIINTGAKKWLDYHFGSTPLPYTKSNLIIDEEKFTKKKLLKEISNIPSDDNDIIYMFYASRTREKGEFKFPGGYLNNQELKKAIKKIDKYGKIFVILDACYAGAFLEPLDGLKNYVGIGSCPKEEICIGGILPFMLAKYKDKSIDELVELANTEIENSKKNKATLVSFYSDESFGNEPLIPSNHLAE